MSLQQRLLCALAALCTVSAASAVEVQVKNPWVRSAAEGQAATPAYVDLRSDTPLKLVGATSDWAQRIEIRAVELNDGLPVDRVVPALDVPAGTEFRLAPGGSYLALVDIKRGFGNGDFVPITLRFEDANHTAHTVDLRAQVRGLLLKPPAAKPE
jgi:copper(I)-binding protein